MLHRSRECSSPKFRRWIPVYMCREVVPAHVLGETKLSDVAMGFQRTGAERVLQENA